MGLVIFGLWTILNSIITILQLFNFNLGITAIRNVSRELAHDNRQGVSDVINGLLHITIALMVIACGAGLFLSHAAVNEGWWGLKDVQVKDISMCVFLSAVMAGLKYFDQVLQHIIKAKEKFALAAILNMIDRFGLLIITLVMAINNYSLVSILWANVVFLLACLLMQFLSIKVIMPFYTPGLVKDAGQYKRLLNFSVWAWLQSMMVALTFQSDRFWVSSYAGLKEVSGYGLVSTMFNHIHIIFTAMAMWLMPRISAMTTKGGDPSALYRKVRGGLFGVVVVSLLFFYFVSPVLFPLWVGQQTYSYMVSYIGPFVAFEIVYAHTIMPVFYLNAAGKERLATRMTLLYCGACYTGMLCGLLLFHSSVALVCGLAVGMALSVPIINMAVQKSMHGSYSLEEGIMEMAPMYISILLIYTDNAWLGLGLCLLILGLLWKYYLSSLFNKNLWKRVANT
jgi:O-antigen/teichoic acid export membrane protein